MQKLSLELETVTPLFLSGAEPRGAPELRPPSFRGALRYWLRAALGGVLGDDAQDVHREESTVFGSPAEDIGQASPIVLRITHGQLPVPQVFQKQQSDRVRKEGREIWQSTGRDYLFWSMDKTGKVEHGNYQAPKQYIAPGTTFQLIVSTRPGIDATAENSVHRRAVWACWLLVNLGGIGSRSRRCAGSLSTLKAVEFENLTFQLESSKFEEQLAQGLRQIRASLSPSEQSPHLRTLPLFDVLHPDHCRIWVLGVWTSSEKAVDAIGSALRDFRTYREPDHSSVARWLTGEALPTVERSAFGLPIPYRYSDGGPSGTVQGYAGNSTIDRRASPLWLKVSKTSDGRYIGVATLFKSAFLEDGAKLEAKTRSGRPPRIDPPSDYSLVEQWITGFSTAREVHYV